MKETKFKIVRIILSKYLPKIERKIYLDIFYIIDRTKTNDDFLARKLIFVCTLQTSL